MGGRSSETRCQRCWRKFLCSAGLHVTAMATVSLGFGTALAFACISELCVVFAAQAILLLLWSCCRKPRASISWVYLFLCSVVLVRESVIVMLGVVPCGIAVESSCEESKCTEQSHILWLRTSCRKRECVRTFPHSDGWVFIYNVPPGELWTPWLLSAHLCVWAAFVLTVVQLCRWQAAARRKDPCSTEMLGARSIGGNKEFQDSEDREGVTQPIAVILALPVTYGICAVHSLRVLTMNRDDAWTAEAMMDAAELYSSMALYAFQSLLVLYVDQGLRPGLHVGNSVIDLSVVEGEALELRRSLQRLVAVGIKQYIFLTFGCNMIEVSAKAWDWWYPSSCTSALSRVAAMWFPRHNISITFDEQLYEQFPPSKHGSSACADLWNVTSLLMVVADFFTCSIALFAIWTYERSFADFFHPMKPFWKFWGVKGLLSVGWLQAIVLMVIGFVAEGGRWSDENFRTFLNFHMVSVEALLLACLNMFAYPPTVMPWAPCSTTDMRPYNAGGCDHLDELDPVDMHPRASPTVLGNGEL
eukprot:TRINITY_DN25636_c0_g1_i1.p1 TRINITY_DN25636_c0_g1~~TRINITY_DN25636_c0_g1_i1.p1  ORF type:complete len:530 (-),score=81.20 TRINITY_DN25636_c0_g1_i1:87-1676(-)